MSLPPYPGGPEGQEPEGPGQPTPTPPPPPPAYPGAGTPPQTPHDQYPPTHYPSGQYPSPTSVPGFGDPGWNDVAKSTSGVAIAALVTGIVGLCLCGIGGIFAVILGIIGILKTKGGKAKGMWMAVTGLVLGIVGIVLLIGLIAVIVFGMGQIVTTDNAEVGQCVNVETDDDNVFLTKSDCDDAHDAEIAWTGTLGTAQDAITDSPTLRSIDPDDVTDSEASRQICGLLVEAPYSDYVRDTAYEWTFIGNEDEEDRGDPYVCYLEMASGKLDSSID